MAGCEIRFTVRESLRLIESLFEFLARNWAMMAIVLTTIVLLIVPALVLLKYVRISLNIMRTTKPPLTRNPLDYAPLRGELLSFPAFDGVRLAGTLIRADPAVPRRGMIVFAHEFCADMQSCARYCRPLQEVGYDIFTFDFRNHGQSEFEPGYTPRQWITDREVHDMRGAIAFVRAWLEEQQRPGPIGLFGMSRGACAALVAAAEAPEVRAIVSDGAYSTDTTIEYFMKRWAYIFATVRVVYENHPPLFWRFLRWLLMCVARREFRCNFPSVRKVIQRMPPRPLLFIHGERDSFLPVEQSRRLYALAGQPKFLWIAPGARHNQAAVLHPELYAQMTINFFDEYLATASAPPGTKQPSAPNEHAEAPRSAPIGAAPAAP